VDFLNKGGILEIISIINLQSQGDIMSWNISMIGTSDKICEALDKRAEEMDDLSKEEFEQVLPHLKEIVRLNFNHEEPVIDKMLLELVASGHRYKKNGEWVFSNVQVKLNYSYRELCV